MKNIKYLGAAVVVFLLLLSGCSSNKDDAKEVVDAIIVREIEIDNSNLDGEEPYNYLEEDFSFRIWKEKNTSEYIIDAWIPVSGESNSIERLYSYRNSEVERLDKVSMLSSILNEGSYEEIYTSGKFK